MLVVTNNLAVLYKEMGQNAEALALLKQVKTMREKQHGKEHPLYAQALNNLASLYKEMEQYEEALPLFLQAKAISENVYGKEHYLFFRELGNLASLYNRMKNYKQAWELLFQAIDSELTVADFPSFNQPWIDSLAEASYPSFQHIGVRVNFLQLAYDLLEKDSTITDARGKQTRLSDLAARLLIKARNQVTGENDKLLLLNWNKGWLERSLAVLSPEEDATTAFRLSDQNKSVLLLQATKSEEAYFLGELPDSLARKDKNLLKEQSKLQASLFEKRTEEEKSKLRNNLNKVNEEINNFVAMLKTKYPRYYQLKYEQKDAKIEEIQKLLDTDAALLEYVLGDSVVHIFYVDKQSVNWTQFRISNKELTAKIKVLHSTLSDYAALKKAKEVAYQTYTETAHWFYQNLLAPVLKNKTKIKKLVVVADGELGHLPFEAFLVEAAPKQGTDYKSLHYLIKDYTVSYNYSATLWKENLSASSKKNNGQMLAMAANYASANKTDINRNRSLSLGRLESDLQLRSQLSPLPAARQEVEALQSVYNGFFAFDSIASEKTAKRLAPKYAVIHLAMHGLLNQKQPMLSSLAFSEDNDSVESNFLQAYEISKMELNADLVVLSACETGFGKFEEGNGIASLARAFMYAGSPALVVSLWQVNDAATSMIMQLFYQHLAAGMSKDEALRQAKLGFMQSQADIHGHPVFWSPFILIGNQKPISLSKKQTMLPWLLGGGGALLLLGLGIVFRRKKKK